MQSLQAHSDTFAALGDATRLAIVSRLASEGDMTVQEIARPFAMSLPAVSQHLKGLDRLELFLAEPQSPQPGDPQPPSPQPAVPKGEDNEP